MGRIPLKKRLQKPGILPGDEGAVLDTRCEYQVARFYMHNYKGLLVWQKARILVKDIYKITNDLPNSEKYGLVSQIRRAVVSIPSNIAEGCGKNSDKDLTRFLEIANSSTFELETQIILAHDLEFIKLEDFENLQNKITEIQKMIFGLIKKIRLKS